VISDLALDSIGSWRAFSGGRGGKVVKEMGN